MIKSVLEPCPFCGGKATIKAKEKRETGFTIWCECKVCRAKTEGYCPNIKNEDKALENIEESKTMAIKLWNRRAQQC